VDAETVWAVAGALRLSQQQDHTCVYFLSCDPTESYGCGLEQHFWPCLQLSWLSGLLILQRNKTFHFTPAGKLGHLSRRSSLPLHASHVAAGVLTDGQVGDPVGMGEAAVQSAGTFGGLGGVFGHVARDLGVGHVAAAGDRADVELATPSQRASQEPRRGGFRDADGAGGLVDGVGEQGDSGPGGRNRGRPGGAVEPDNGMEVDDATTLVFGDLGVGDPELRREGLAGEPGLAGQ
jgi:hypothetical protein